MKQTVPILEPASNAVQLAAAAVSRAAVSSSAVERTWRSAGTEAVVFAVVACVVCLGYCLFTEQIWEDALITLRHSERLLRGEGLVYNAGERVQGFTSPINVLLLTLCHVVSGQSYTITLWLYRILTIAAFAGSVGLLLRAMGNVAPRWAPARWFAGVAYIFEIKSIAFSTNGMETGFMLLFLAWGVYLLSQASPEQWLVRGLCWAGLMWTRPDGCVYIAALGLAELLFASTARRATLVSLLESAGICTLAYGPWFFWTWWYYGSPIPQTVLAKANAEFGPLAQLQDVMDRLVQAVVSTSSNVFRPIYYGDSNNWLPDAAWSRVINGLSKAAGLFCLLYWLFPVRDRLGRSASFCFAFLCFYLAYLPVAYAWYYAPVALLGIVALARGMTVAAGVADEQLSFSAAIRVRPLVVGVALALLAGGQIVLFGLAAYRERIQQAEIETGNRAAIGKWLNENAEPRQTVYLEPLGYIGYFSGLRMRDFPGLVSPEVVQLRASLGVDPASLSLSRVLIIPKLKPDWVVLRFVECELLRGSPAMPEFQREYQIVRVFDVNEKLDQYKLRPGDNSLRFDAGYVVFQRIPSASSPAANE